MQEFEVSVSNPAFPRHLDALIVEDVEGDARLIVKALTRGGFAVSYERVESHAQMCEALDRRHWDVVISDCALPKFSAKRALELLHERKLSQLPVIVVSGVVREEAAHQLFHAGAHDFLSKSSLSRLVPVVERELDEAARRAEQQAARTALERRVEQSDRRFRNLFDLAPDGVLLLNAGGKISEINRRASAMFGYMSDDLLGTAVQNILPSFKLDELRPADDTVTVIARTLGMEGRQRDGQSFPVEVSIDAIPVDDGQAFIVAVHDATERQRHRQELQTALAEARAIRDQLDSVLDCAPAIILTLDLNGAIKFINRLTEGRQKHDVIGLDWVSFVPEKEREKTRKYLHNVLHTGKHEAFELCTEALDQSAVWWSCVMGPLRSRDRVIGAVIIAQEVTEVRRVREELTATQRLAAVGTLAAGIAHEINTPMQFVNDSLHFLRDAARDALTVIQQHKNWQRVLQSGGSAAELDAASREAEQAEQSADLEYLTEQVPKAFDRCIDGLQRMTAIVRSLKEFAHPASKQASAVDLNRAIQSTLTIARNEYKYVAELQTDFGELPMVVCHVNDINQVVLNLVINAAHAIADKVRNAATKGVIRVATRCDDQTVVIAVSDTGSGIPEPIRHRIFEPFFTTKEVGKGTGQGLALAWSVVTEKHKGTLTFETELGRGTTFFIRLPIAGP
jgi:two-component system, NtrC family, sensor kinase